jgi:acetyl-CoA C-acetyltransferase
MRETVIVGGIRTAFGKFGGAFKGLSAAELGAAALKGVLHQSGADWSSISSVWMGMVLQAGAGQNPARQAAILAGLDPAVVADTVNKVCASGLRAVALADQMIRAGDGDAVLAGGMESMSQAPYADMSARWGARMGNKEQLDIMIKDGLLCPFNDVPMAIYGDQAAKDYGISRAEQDAWALRSHMRAVSASRQGLFAEEIVSVHGNGALIATDEGPRPDTNASKLALLRPLYGGTSTITAGNAPGVNDGAAVLLLMSREEAGRQGLKPLATIKGYATAGAEPHQLAAAPAMALRKLLKNTGTKLEQIRLFEINEAFASVALSCGKLLGWNAELVNVNGGAIALGHPIGASGARIVLTLMHELRRRGGGLGAAAICSGGAHGDALLIEVEG